MHMVKQRQAGINSQASMASAAAFARSKKVLSRPVLRLSELQQLSAFCQHRCSCAYITAQTKAAYQVPKAPLT